jgi:predicted metal-dependent HD superfamily phosphohydrolase
MVSTAHDTALQRRFIALWRCCSTDDDASAAAVWRQLSRRYAEPHRRYHGLNHVAFCLGQLDLAATLMESAPAVELAVWFHDAVYRPGDPANEAASAALFRELAASVDPTLVESVASLILDTTHLAAPTTEDGRYMVDIDLASLGLPWPRFLRDSEAIRDEQPDVPDAAYTTAQRSFLKGLLARPRLYRTRFFQDRCEATARSNIGRTLDGMAA